MRCRTNNVDISECVSSTTSGLLLDIASIAITNIKPKDNRKCPRVIQQMDAGHWIGERLTTNTPVSPAFFVQSHARVGAEEEKM